MKGYKGFDKDLKCRGFQYEVGKEYETDSARLCSEGFHACENPFDVLNYYPLVDGDGNNSRYAEVDLDATNEKDSDSKRVGKKIHIVAEIGLKGLVKAAIDFLFESNTAKKDTESISYARFSQLAASGDGSQLAASGYGSKLAASGYGSKLAASGEKSVVMNAGIRGWAKASKGSWITLAEWESDGNKWFPVSVVTRKVDGEEIKADTYYCLIGGKFEEAK